MNRNTNISLFHIRTDVCAYRICVFVRYPVESCKLLFGFKVEIVNLNALFFCKLQLKRQFFLLSFWKEVWEWMQSESRADVFAFKPKMFVDNDVFVWRSLLCRQFCFHMSLQRLFFLRFFLNHSLQCHQNRISWKWQVQWMQHSNFSTHSVQHFSAYHIHT